MPPSATVSSWLQLAHKTAVVTGAASGIGAAVAKALSLEQCHLVLADRDPDRLAQVAQECLALSSTPISVTSIACDVAKEEDIKSLFQQRQPLQDSNNNTSSPPPPPTILVNCAGITRDGWIGRMSVQQWDQVQDVNLKGTFLCCREFLAQPHFELKKTESNATKGQGIICGNGSTRSTDRMVVGGSIINVSSVVATQGNLGQTNYAASKGGVYSFTKALAREVAPRRVRVNCVLPGFIDTEMTGAVPDAVKETVQKKIVWQQQFGKPEDIANLILFLASCQRSGYITGEALECSGMISL